MMMILCYVDYHAADAADDDAVENERVLLENVDKNVIV